MELKRIKITQKDNETLIEIFPIQDSLKSKLLFAWLLLWTLCGIVVFSQFFSNMNKEEKLLMAVWMAFWAYFEYKISTVYLWRKNGSEAILITAESLTYTPNTSQKSTKKQYYLDNIAELELYEFNKNNFSDSLQSAFWVKGTETVFFKHFASKIGLGLQLNKEEAKMLFQTINKTFKKKR